MATHSSTLAWKIPWAEEPGRLQSMGSLRVRHTERLHFHFSLSCIGEGNGHPLQCSCLENPRDWWAAVYGVAQSQTRLKQFSSSSSSSCRVLTSAYIREAQHLLVAVIFIISITIPTHSMSLFSYHNINLWGTLHLDYAQKGFLSFRWIVD